jgi:lipopolysaccharide transport system permease protein
MQEQWDEIILPKRGLFDLRLNELWKYRDLLSLLVRRDFVSTYKQTLLGPLWYVLQALFTAFAFTVVFQKIFGMPTEGVPPMLFYLSGLVCWNYFSQCLTKTSNTFVSNSTIFGKVYFPRLVIPISTVISSLIGMGIQLLVFLGFIIAYSFLGVKFNFTSTMLLLPFLILMMAMMGLGLGIVISSLSIKYRDFQHITSFGVLLLMYATPVMYPFSWIRGGLRYIMILNPLTPIIESFRFAFLGVGEFSVISLTYSAVFSIAILFIGILMFNRNERTFIDVV